MICKLLLFFLSLCSAPLCAQADSAFIKKVSNVYSEIALPFQIKVNGTVMSSTDSLIKVPINESGFDTIVLINANFTKESIMKLRPENTYLVYDNPCSFYTLSSAQNHKRGLVKFKVVAPKSGAYRAGNDLTAKLYINKKDKYHYYPHSGNCGDAPQRLQIQNEGGKELCFVNFHFLHGEKLLYTFNEETGMVDIQLTGFVKKNREYKVKYDKQ